MYTLAVVNAEGHGQPVAHAVLANFIVLVLFNLKNISNTTKVKLYETFVIPIVLYGSKCWCLRKAEMTWLRRLLRVTRRDRMKNETVWSTLHLERTLVDRIAQ